MKKMLSVLTALTLGSTTAVSVVGCGVDQEKQLIDIQDFFKDFNTEFFVDDFNGIENQILEYIKENMDKKFDSMKEYGLSSSVEALEEDTYLIELKTNFKNSDGEIKSEYFKGSLSLTVTAHLGPHWDLNLYNEDGKEHRIFIERNKEKILNGEISLVKLIWTGFIDSEDATAMERFEDQEVEKHLTVLNENEVAKDILENIDNSEVKEFKLASLQLKLDKFLKSKTGTENPKDCYLQVSEADLKNIVVKFI
ncbi:hypothetical protein [Spiroplasma platyhelix]|uniref:Lipoprotein n=1 Tax=Spiroplasma platyhelix PALS-1 TaxID=1276218 RepID=A0A846TW17_9MOLU|nr:hypothetical protein [Spiroplasma platyhelix]MBE4703979.1 hypothetical protein [Spiroplasma platyhelix PALS-1]NKE38352.1 hypothetical protein [Spiroplasma platyhelix PALS-1]UJB29237.1 hypothetical protein SPLAT_v1c04730 [Spiroplasma platyhelix PALS-1]